MWCDSEESERIGLSSKKKNERTEKFESKICLIFDRRFIVEISETSAKVWCFSKRIPAKHSEYVFQSMLGSALRSRKFWLWYNLGVSIKVNGLNHYWIFHSDFFIHSSTRNGTVACVVKSSDLTVWWCETGVCVCECVEDDHNDCNI